MTTRQSVLLLAAGGLLTTAFVVPANAATSATTSATLSTATQAKAAPAAVVKKAAASKKKYWKTKYCYGKTTKVSDGDTIEVKLSKGCMGWKKGKVVVVRNAGIQATEVKHPWAKAECWSGEAVKLMRKQFPIKSKVRLGAYTKTRSGENTKDGRARYVMYAYSYHPGAKGGPWLDAQAKLVSAGFAFPKGEHIEAAHNIKYLGLSQKAIAQKVGMWGNPSRCGVHTPDAQLQAWTGWKTDGRDTKASANTEWFKVRNTGSVAVPLYGWKVRDGSHTFGGGKGRWMTIKYRVTLQPGQVLTIYPGKGTNDPANLRFFNGHPRLPFYPNAKPYTPSDKDAGVTKSTAYTGYATILMDPSGNFRAQSLYPCVYNCSAPPLRVVSVDANGGRDQDETATIVNYGNTDVDLSGMVVQVASARKEFPTGMRMPAGGRMIVHFDRSGSDSPSRVYFTHHGSGTLTDRGGKVWLRTADATSMSLYSWGDGGSYKF